MINANLLDLAFKSELYKSKLDKKVEKDNKQFWSKFMKKIEKSSKFDK